MVTRSSGPCHQLPVTHSRHSPSTHPCPLHPTVTTKLLQGLVGPYTSGTIYLAAGQNQGFGTPPGEQNLQLGRSTFPCPFFEEFWLFQVLTVLYNTARTLQELQLRIAVSIIPVGSSGFNHPNTAWHRAADMALRPV